jgi:hypothetical protein
MSDHESHGREETARARPHARLAAGLFMFWGITLLWLLASGRYTSFLAAAFWPLVLVGALLCGAFFTAVYVRPRGHASTPEAAWLGGAVLAVPLIYAILVADETVSAGTGFADRVLATDRYLARSGPGSSTATPAR